MEERARTTLGTAGIVFFVLAAISPLGAAVAIVPISIARGNGIGITGTYLVAGVVLALFGVAYVRMSRHMPLVGAFSVYATKGFGRNTGAATAYVAVLAYNMATIGIFGTVAYFAHVLGRDGFGVDLPWQLWAVAIFALLGALTWRDLSLSKRILGVALAVEMAVMLVFDRRASRASRSRCCRRSTC
jgi:amino acid transporter